jgi:glycosyltransferase involved in cell wall biosynthesis
MKVCYIVCTIGRQEQALACIDSILKQSGDIEVVVVDQSDVCGRYANDGRLKVIHSRKDGLSHARNLGFHNASGDIVAYIDDDALPAKDHSEKLQAAFSNGSIDCVAGRILVAGSDIPYAKTQTADSRYLPLGGWNVMLGGNIGFRRSTLEEVGPFDEAFGAGREWASGEETDYFLRMRYAGKKVFYCADLVIFHPAEPASHSGESLSRKLFRYGKGHGALFAKHYKQFGNRKMLLTFAWSLAKPSLRMLQYFVTRKNSNFKVQRSIFRGRVQGFRDYMLQPGNER